MVDTTATRRQALNFFQAPAHILPDPDTWIGGDDRQHVWGFYRLDPGPPGSAIGGGGVKPRPGSRLLGDRRPVDELERPPITGHAMAQAAPASAEGLGQAIAPDRAPLATLPLLVTGFGVARAEDATAMGIGAVLVVGASTDPNEISDDEIAAVLALLS